MIRHSNFVIRHSPVRRGRPRNQGFTLIEVVAVVVLIGILAASVAWAWSGHRGAVGFDDFIQQLAANDHLTRVLAEQSGQPVQIAIDLDAQEIRRTTRAPDGSALTTRYLVPAGVEVRRFRSAAQEIETGTATLTESSRGTGPSYALLLADAQHRTWLLFAGLTGQATPIEHDEQVQNIFENLQPTGVDAR